ncbi:hemerythrin domain-containing protein [Dechloromonas sp. H13]|uniref:hemerythrin domain-containing protein n=1 Tax=Dechloromonas sp. H13 TaxID=2570193 RepID=UPI0012915B63|nr:hemerythrin domain-containing protein [Dechloromonas sp. H13]
MKRHEALQDLSREHHLALKLALHGRRAIASGDPGQITAAANACAEAFGSELGPHFVREETDVLPLLAQAGETALVQRTLNEHAELRSLAARLLDADMTALERFVELLGAHVRFEEQELFEAAQTCLDLGKPRQK